MSWCMEMQVSDGVLHGVLDGEVLRNAAWGVCCGGWRSGARGCQHKMGCLNARLGAG